MATPMQNTPRTREENRTALWALLALFLIGIIAYAAYNAYYTTDTYVVTTPDTTINTPNPTTAP